LPGKEGEPGKDGEKGDQVQYAYSCFIFSAEISTYCILINVLFIGPTWRKRRKGFDPGT